MEASRQVYATSSSSMGENIVIIGGGFAGMQSARRLRKRFRSVTLIDAKEYFEFTPGMHRPFTDVSKHAELVFDYAEYCSRIDVMFVCGYASGIDNDVVIVKRRDAGIEDLRIQYDFCIVSVGCHYGLPIANSRRATPVCECLWYPTITSVATQCGWAGSPHDLRWNELTLAGRRMHLEGEYLTIKRLAETKAHVAVVGGGFVGVEFAMELALAFPELEITLLEQKEAVVVSMPKASREYAQSALDKAGVRCLLGVDYFEVMRQEGEGDFWERRGLSYPDRFFMATGLRPHADFLPAEVRTPAGWVQVNEALQVVRELEGAGSSVALGGRVFAAGNCVGDVPGIGRLPKNVFPAEHMAVQVVSNIIKLSVAGGLPRRLTEAPGASSSRTGTGRSLAALGARGLGQRPLDRQCSILSRRSGRPSSSSSSASSDLSSDSDSSSEVMRSVSKTKTDVLLGLEVGSGSASVSRGGASSASGMSRMCSAAAQAATSSGATPRVAALDPVSHPWPGSAVCALSLGPRDGVCAMTSTDPDSGYTMLTGRAVILQKDTIQWSKIDEFKSGSVGSMLWSLIH